MLFASFCVEWTLHFHFSFWNAKNIHNMILITVKTKSYKNITAQKYLQSNYRVCLGVLLKGLKTIFLTIKSTYVIIWHISLEVLMGHISALWRSNWQVLFQEAL